ncbi:MAG: purH [Gammaproteobacteria bacterium]|jgi:phosphoribosylaminoimidazolecarboxamide formyltransferase/IMP cyclohydrolase|nr:purH [Gammaproteobacteria bacterium]
MNIKRVSIGRVLISVSDKTGIVEFAGALAARHIEIISTGGTSQLLREAHISVRDVAEITGFAEMMDGRVKTLHPKIHGGILGQRDTHAIVAKEHEIDWIDLVVVNLYPFAATIKKTASTFADAIENIDVGGPSMIRAAAKNMNWVGVVVDPSDYAEILAELNEHHGLSFDTRQALATKAFAHTADYDRVIYHYLASRTAQKTQQLQPFFPVQLDLSLEKFSDLRYGENPHQAACAYQFTGKLSGILSATQHQGKQLSYNNMVDADAAITCVREFTQPACVVVKHANPCGVAVAEESHIAFELAFQADVQSAFGGIVALNRVCDKKTAEAIVSIFIEVVVAPAYTSDALTILANKQNLRVLELDFANLSIKRQELKFLEGGVLIQDRDTAFIQQQDLKVVTEAQPTIEEQKTILFIWSVLKQVKSNAIVIAKNNVTVGIGAGQVSRIDAVDIAIRKAGSHVNGAILASDAFFPFRDSIDRLARTSIRVVVQPGGSMRDQEVIDACNEHGIAMVFTGIRCFKH